MLVSEGPHHPNTSYLSENDTSVGMRFLWNLGPEEPTAHWARIPLHFPGAAHLYNSCGPKPGRSQWGRSRRSGQEHYGRYGSRGWDPLSIHLCLGGRHETLFTGSPASWLGWAAHPRRRGQLCSYQGRGRTHPHKMLPGCPAQSPWDSQLHFLL